MNFVKSLLITAFLFSGVQAFAHHDDACKSYLKGCKGNMKAKWDCAGENAAKDTDTVKGQACTDAIAAHKSKMEAKKEKKMNKKDEGGTPTESAPTSH